MKYFYHKIIVIESLVEQLHSMDLADEEKHHLATLVDSSIHNAILDEILSNLSDEDKKEFLRKLHQDPESEKLLEFLNEKVDGVEDKIKKVSNELILEMHQDIKEAKEMNKK